MKIAIAVGLVVASLGGTAASQAATTDASPPSAQAQAMIDKAQAAIDAAGPAAKEAFVVETGKAILYPIRNPDNVSVIHKATGMVCGVSADSQLTIKVYRQDTRGHAIDVSCDMVLRNTSQTLYAFQQPGSSVAKELDRASLAITTLHQDAVLQDKSPLDSFEDMNRFLSLRDYETIKDTVARAYIRPSPDPRGLYESAWVGKQGDWFILQRSTGPAYWNWMAGALWHDVWRNMLPDMAAEETAQINALVDARQKAERESQSSSSK